MSLECCSALPYEPGANNLHPHCTMVLVGPFMGIVPVGTSVWDFELVAGGAVFVAGDGIGTGV